MKNQIVSAVFLYLILSTNLLFAQDAVIDSLKNVLQTQKNDSNKVNTLYELSDNCDEKDILLYALPALKLANELKYKKGIANASMNVGYAYINESKFTEAFALFQNSLSMQEELKDSVSISICLNSLGNIYYRQGNIAMATEFFYKALKIKEEIGDKEGLANSLGNIGEVYNSQGEILQSMTLWKKSLKVSEDINYEYGIASACFGIGNCYEKLKQFDLAMEFFQKSYKIQDKINDTEGLSITLNNMGLNYFEKGNDSLALEYLKKGSEKAMEINDKHDASNALNNIGKIYFKMNDISRAKIYCLNSFKIAEEIAEPIIKKNASEMLHKIYFVEGNYKAAYNMLLVFKSTSDSLENAEVKKLTLKKQMQYDFDKKELASKAEQNKKDALSNAEISKQKIIRNFSMAGAFGLLSVGGYVFYNFRKRKKLENQQALTDERLRISRELHDDIGSTLGSIAVYSDVAKNRSSKNENPVEVLSKIGNASRELIEKMSDIVWSLNPDNETFDQLQNRMQAFAAMILTPRNIVVDFKVDAELKMLQLTNEQRKNIFLIYKEAVHNIIKYAECKNVTILLGKSGNNLMLTIKDDGKGFENTHLSSYNGNGLKNMKARASDIKAVLTINSAINEGTVVNLTLTV